MSFQVELKGDRIELLGAVEPDIYPLQKKRHSLEFLRSESSQTIQQT